MPKQSQPSLTKVSPSEAFLNSEVANYCTCVGKLLPALKSAICLKENHSEHPKTAAALVKLFKGWLNMTDEQKLNACGKDQRILAVVVKEIATLGCPGSEGELAGWFTANRTKGGKRALEECHEHLKLSLRVLGVAPTADWGKQAVEALDATPKEQLRVWDVISTHKTLMKTGVAGIDAAFKAKARELFPLATYFASAE